MSTYKFFTVEGPEGKFLAANKAIRSHAMKTALRTRTQRADNGQQDDEPSLADSKEVVRRKEELKTRFRLPKRPKGNPNAQAVVADQRVTAPTNHPLVSGRQTAQAVVAQRLVQPVQRLGSGVADPFRSLPVPIKGKVDVLVKYMLTGFSLNLSTVDSQRPWFGYAMQSPEVMHATLALSAGFWAASMSTPDAALEREGFWHQGQAMAIVRANLQARNITNTVLATIAGLGNVEMFQGRFEAAAVHLRGVRDLVEARGGVETILDDFYLCRCIDWVDVQTASGLGRAPLFPPLHGGMDDVLLPPATLHQAGLPPLAPALCPAVWPIFHLLRLAVAARDSPAVSANSHRILLHLADSSILHFLYGDGSSRRHDQHRQEKDECNRTDTVLVQATHVFLHAALRQVPPTSSLLRTLVGRLQDALTNDDALPSETDFWGAGGDHDDVSALAWAAFVGLAATSESADGERHAWFSNLFGAAISRARAQGGTEMPWPLADDDFVGQAEIRRVLEPFLWRDEFCMPVLHAASWLHRPL
ncbi:hypothetical protein QBC47DRAFT_386929 [Echria macrotheca]|uniref:Tachykinin family protein n=1 Tax=Echria macrotheca TaxID=438768 RepID=A0AAJ0BD65_9PEZI|nr:hypothetical protein QBC47DRAFT_386929 [Echria macrotheca]